MRKSDSSRDATSFANALVSNDLFGNMILSILGAILLVFYICLFMSYLHGTVLVSPQ